MEVLHLLLGAKASDAMPVEWGVCVVQRQIASRRGKKHKQSLAHSPAPASVWIQNAEDTGGMGEAARGRASLGAEILLGAQLVGFIIYLQNVCLPFMGLPKHFTTTKN